MNLIYSIGINQIFPRRPWSLERDFSKEATETQSINCPANSTQLLLAQPPNEDICFQERIYFHKTSNELQFKIHDVPK